MGTSFYNKCNELHSTNIGYPPFHCPVLGADIGLDFLGKSSTH